MNQRRWDEKEPTPSIATGGAASDSAYLEGHLRRIMGIGPRQQSHVSQDAARCQARLAFIIETWNKDGCFEHGEECQDRATCLAREIIARESAWL